MFKSLDAKVIPYLGLFGLLRRKDHKLGGFNNTHLSLTVLGAGKSQIEVLVDSVFGDDPPLALQVSCPDILTWQEAERASSFSPVSFYKDPSHPIMRAPPYDLIISQKSRIQYHHIGDKGFKIGGHKCSAHSIPYMESMSEGASQKLVFFKRSPVVAIIRDYWPAYQVPKSVWTVVDQRTHLQRHQPARTEGPGLNLSIVSPVAVGG